MISIRFVLGDIIGALVVILFLAIFRKVTKDPNMIEVRNLYKSFKADTGKKGFFGAVKEPFFAVNDMSFTLNKGQVLSILGPNGCGKTTTLRMIAGMLEPSSGTAIVNNIDVRGR